MGGRMTYQRFLKRNRLAEGDYDPQDPRGILRGDLRRMERDADSYAEQWADELEIPAMDIQRVIDRFLSEP